MIFVKLSLAIICFASQINAPIECYPALVGVSTPVGEYTLNLRLTETVGYGGDVLQFAESETTVFAVHRLWLLSPNQQRAKRIRSSKPNDRVITNGCINVLPEVYDKLKNCCQGQQIIIEN